MASCLALIWGFPFIGAVAAVSGLLLTVAASWRSVHDAPQARDPTGTPVPDPLKVPHGGSSELTLTISTVCGTPTPDACMAEKE